MVFLSLFTFFAIAAIPADEPGQDPRAEYVQIATKAGRDADSQVRLALWCEAHNLTQERQKHLTIAILAEPSHGLARGMLGMVDDRGSWRKPEDVADRFRGDADSAAMLQQYRARRDKLVETAESHRQLASWCAEHGMEAESKVHLAAIVRIDPSREEAWKELGFRKVSGRWQRTEDQAWIRTELDARRKADAKWRPILQRWKTQLGQKSKHVQAEKSLAELNDPFAAGAIMKVFGGPEHQERAVELLARLDGMDASRALASIAASTPSDRTRMLAADRLAARDPREYAGMLIGMLRDPIKFEVKPVGGPGSPGELYVQGARVNSRRFYAAPASPATIQPGDVLGFDEYGLPVVNRVFGYAEMPISVAIDQRMMGAPDLTGAGDALAKTSLGAAGKKLGDQMERNQNQNSAIAAQLQDYAGDFGYFAMPLVDQLPIGQYMLRAQRQAASSREQLQADVAELEQYNEGIRQFNERVTLTLKSALRGSGDLDRASWLKWLSKLTATSVAPIVPPLAKPRYPASREPGDTDGPIVTLPALAEGTPVWTIDGPRPIEGIQAGDRVLTQDIATGKLAFEPALTIRPSLPGPAMRIIFDEVSISVAELERFWIGGRGWVKASELKPGDAVRMIDGLARVSAIELVDTASQRHLEVAGGRGIFVGSRGLLAHDGRVAKPVTSPFDALGDSKR